ncbi:MAG: hypothetical protein R3F34_06885 [Planctomycetota bacterium]
MHGNQFPVQSRSGAASLAVVAGLLALSGVVLIAITLALRNADVAARPPAVHGLASAGDGVARLALAALWGESELAHRGREHTIGELRDEFDRRGLTSDGPPLELVGDLGLPTEGDEHRMGGVVVERVLAERRDDGLATRVRFSVDVRADPVDAEAEPERSTVRREYEFAPPDWSGLGFALLANDVSCAFCHLDVDSAPRRHNRTVARAGSFERVRVGSVLGLRLRNATDRSFVAGSLCLGAGGTTPSGSEIVDWGRLDLDSASFDARGRLVERADQRAADGSFGLRARDLLPADARRPAPFENLYLDQAGVAAPVDGPLPTRFPAVFPDDGGIDVSGSGRRSEDVGNARVDDAEFEWLAARAQGTLRAARAVVVPRGEVVRGPGAVAALVDGLAVQEGGTTELARTVRGNLVLVGTADRPVEIDGDVAIDGDLVVSGVVRGLGVLRVRGNVYLPSDLVYADGTDAETGARSFGLAESGAENALAVAAGGCIVLGDPFAPVFGESSLQESVPNFTAMQFAAFNRVERRRANGEGSPPFEPLERVPRYYRETRDAPVPFARDGEPGDPWRGAEHPSSWEEFELLDADDPALGRCVVVDIEGSGGWIGRDEIRLLVERIASERARWRPVVVDAVLYSSNAVVGLASPHAVGHNGRLTIEGAVVAPDVALLAPHGLTILGDPRAARILRIPDHRRVEVRRVRDDDVRP